MYVVSLAQALYYQCAKVGEGRGSVTCGLALDLVRRVSLTPHK